MDRPNSMQSINEVIHKEKKQKKTTDISSIDYSLIDISTVVKGSTPVNSTIEQIQAHQNSHKLAGQKALIERTKSRKREQNILIDESLHAWVMEGIVNQDYATWVARCCHVLGLDTVNRVAIASRGGKQPQRLFSSLLKGHMNLKAKQDYYDMDTLNADSANSLRTEIDQ